jgi:membrane protein YqaA with SNARE-associated domain
MGEFVGWISSLALAWGAPGLFLVAALDSTFLPLPGITDLLLIVLVTRRPDLVLLYVAGSLSGCLVMHAIGKKGGEAFVRARFGSGKVERTLSALRRHGVMAVLIPSLLPPPAPFRIFVLLAGVVGITAARFAVAIAIGRSARYLGVGFLAVRYGGRAETYLRENGARASLVLVVALAVGFGAFLWFRKARAGKNR